MGDLTWLSTLLVATGGLVAWLVRWIVRRERERAEEIILRERQIADQWRTTAETSLDNDRRTNEILARVLAVMEHPPWVATVPQAGWDGSPGYDGSRHRRTESPWTR